MQAVVTQPATSIAQSRQTRIVSFQPYPPGLLPVGGAQETRAQVGCGDPDAARSGDVEAVRTDPIVAALNAVLQTACDQTALPSALFVRSIERAIQAHLAHEHRVARSSSATRCRGLTRSQERRAKHFLATDTGEYVSIARVAEVCTLSRKYFIRAFKETTGETPHRWRSRFRVEKAKELLQGDRSIAEIALDCGFADQSHLTRAFAKVTGLPPGVWRRKYRGTADGLVHDFGG